MNANWSFTIGVVLNSNLVWFTTRHWIYRSHAWKQTHATLASKVFFWSLYHLPTSHFHPRLAPFRARSLRSTWLS
ncbi:uncharacterized protein LY89DRAFT_27709 [Mollisia scopiformis]|uniref:Uncharacterized protein n=1 Tax=Mollisia scopiformis TaxID=149040 RepID=A0A194XX68_MOLSC|nr:uncharacterized protein LY89DRAFT_27709 [Mollisia scopiformis]KUJ24684.1 hypothetical protein LY89DRAFT_27709 [Mollisia scopiformis]